MTSASSGPLLVNFRDEDVTDAIIDRVAELPDDQPLKLDCSKIRTIYPNTAIPVAAAVDFIRSSGRDIQCVGLSEDASEAHIFDPAVVETKASLSDRLNGKHLTHTVWKYKSEDDAGWLARSFVTFLADRVPCEEGVLDAFNWCLYEIMDNVFQHSHTECGYVMMQIHKSSRQCVIAVADNGIGIQRSMFDSYKRTGLPELDRIRLPEDAIEYALDKGATSKVGRNQGNGLYGLSRAVTLNGGQMSIASGRGKWNLSGKGRIRKGRTSKRMLDPDVHQGTMVDWQLDCSTAVRIDEALGIPNYRPQSLLEGIEDEFGEHRIAVAELEDQLGARSQGSEVRMRLVNYIQAGARNIILDFKGVQVVSSSFADEVLGKLALEMGELPFRRNIRIEHARSTVLALIEHAIALRLEAGDGGAAENQLGASR